MFNIHVVDWVYDVLTLTLALQPVVVALMAQMVNTNGLRF
jgi:hypothetical protein